MTQCRCCGERGRTITTCGTSHVCLKGIHKDAKACKKKQRKKTYRQCSRCQLYSRCWDDNPLCDMCYSYSQDKAKSPASQQVSPASTLKLASPLSLQTPVKKQGYVEVPVQAGALPSTPSPSTATTIPNTSPFHQQPFPSPAAPIIPNCTSVALPLKTSLTALGTSFSFNMATGTNTQPLSTRKRKLQIQGGRASKQQQQQQQQQIQMKTRTRQRAPASALTLGWSTHHVSSSPLSTFSLSSSPSSSSSPTAAVAVAVTATPSVVMAKVARSSPAGPSFSSSSKDSSAALSPSLSSTQHRRAVFSTPSPPSHRNKANLALTNSTINNNASIKLINNVNDLGALNTFSTSNTVGVRNDIPATLAGLNPSGSLMQPMKMGSNLTGFNPTNIHSNGNLNLNPELKLKLNMNMNMNMKMNSSVSGYNDLWYLGVSDTYLTSLARSLPPPPSPSTYSVSCSSTPSLSSLSPFPSPSSASSSSLSPSSPSPSLSSTSSSPTTNASVSYQRSTKRIERNSISSLILALDKTSSISSSSDPTLTFGYLPEIDAHPSIKTIDITGSNMFNSSALGVKEKGGKSTLQTPMHTPQKLSSNTISTRTSQCTSTGAFFSSSSGSAPSSSALLSLSTDNAAPSGNNVTSTSTIRNDNNNKIDTSTTYGSIEFETQHNAITPDLIRDGVDTREQHSDDAESSDPASFSDSFQDSDSCFSTNSDSLDSSPSQSSFLFSRSSPSPSSPSPSSPSPSPSSLLSCSSSSSGFQVSLYEHQRARDYIPLSAMAAIATQGQVVYTTAPAQG